MTSVSLPLSGPVSSTVYSVVWPETEALVRKALTQDTEALLARHRNAHLKEQDGLHDAFFDRWLAFAKPAVAGLDALTERYPCNGSSEAIREIIRQLGRRGEERRNALIVFDGDYEGYEAVANEQDTLVIRVPRDGWRDALRHWVETGVAWDRAQWWVSQPSAVDGNVWPDFEAWLEASAQVPGLEVWVDLTYVGRARIEQRIFGRGLPSHVGGVVFSLSKVMGAYYRRIGGCLARAPVNGLWANRWFKNLDSLWLGEAWLKQAGDALTEGDKYSALQRTAMAAALKALGGDAAWREAGVRWLPSDVPLLMHAIPPRNLDLSALPEHAQLAWQAAARGATGTAARRLCLTPSLCSLLFPEDPAMNRADAASVSSQEKAS